MQLAACQASWRLEARSMYKYYLISKEGRMYGMSSQWPVLHTVLSSIMEYFLRQVFYKAVQTIKGWKMLQPFLAWKVIKPTMFVLKPSKNFYIKLYIIYVLQPEGGKRGGCGLWILLWLENFGGLV